MDSLVTVPTHGGPAILAIESSCDETAAAVLTGTAELRASIVHSQIDMHAVYGGVVPELASRAHIMAIAPVVQEALSAAHMSMDDIRGIAVTAGPGLAGSLLVGLEFAKSLAFTRNLPLTGVNHLEGHVMAACLATMPGTVPMRWPAMALVVSGGHTSIYLTRHRGHFEQVGRTLDDAAGEAFDKVSKHLGLGYPGGAVIDRLAESGDPSAIPLSDGMLKRPGYDFSFSGMKTSVLYWLRDHGPVTGQQVHDLAASFQGRVVEVLARKLVRAAADHGVSHLVVCGGVACNRGLRARIQTLAAESGMTISIPPASLCTDNAAMIGAAGYVQLFDFITQNTGFRSGGIDAVTSWLPGTPLESAE
jgi:N6-L-threonylcarbamoyladenine synthase